MMVRVDNLIMIGVLGIGGYWFFTRTQMGQDLWRRLSSGVDVIEVPFESEHTDPPVSIPASPLTPTYGLTPYNKITRKTQMIMDAVKTGSQVVYYSPSREAVKAQLQNISLANGRVMKILGFQSKSRRLGAGVFDLARRLREAHPNANFVFVEKNLKIQWSWMWNWRPDQVKFRRKLGVTELGVRRRQDAYSFTNREFAGLEPRLLLVEDRPWNNLWEEVRQHVEGLFLRGYFAVYINEINRATAVASCIEAGTKVSTIVPFGLVEKLTPQVCPPNQGQRLSGVIT